MNYHFICYLSYLCTKKKGIGGSKEKLDAYPCIWISKMSQLFHKARLICIIKIIALSNDRLSNKIDCKVRTFCITSKSLAKINVIRYNISFILSVSLFSISILSRDLSVALLLTLRPWRRLHSFPKEMQR